MDGGCGMIVYHLTTIDRVADYVSDGLKRSAGRCYVFPSWSAIELLVETLALESESVESFERHIIVVLDVDEEMLERGPIPRSYLPRLLRAPGVEKLQAASMFLETSVGPERIVAVYDVWGNNATARFRARQRRRDAVWRFLAYARPYRHYIALATFCGLFKFLLPLTWPWMFRVTLDEIVLKPLPALEAAAARAQELAVRAATLRQLALLVLGVNVCWMVACYYRSLFAAKAGHGMIRDLRVALFNHVQRLSHQFFHTHQTGSIVSRVVNDIAHAQNFVGSALTNVWMDGALLLVLLGILFSMHARLALVAISLMPVYVLSLRLLGRRIRLTSREVQQRVEVLSGGLQEKVAGVSIIKSFTREPQEDRAFAAQAAKLYNKVLHSVHYMAVNEMIVGLVVFSSPVLVVWYGANQVLAGQLTVGQYTQFLFYLGMFYAPLQRLSDLSVILATSLAAIDRIFEYFDMMPQVVERPNAVDLVHVRGRLEFDRVTFGYNPGTPVLHDITLTIEPGEIVAFVGPSGSGKSTLANLVPRFYDPTAGVIRLDERDLRDLKLAALRRHIGVVSQDTILFSGTIRENLLLAKPEAHPDEIMEALRAANADEFVNELPEGLWTEIGERGATLSGGQRQRLAIARAFLKNPKILILDEATSALDSRSEHQIQDALSRLLKNRTSIVIAHRLSTVLHADKIVAMERGRIVEIGTHHALLACNGYYAQLYREQFRHLAPGA